MNIKKKYKKRYIDEKEQLLKIQNNILKRKGDECCICSTNEADAFIQPCGHIQYCMSCIRKWYDVNQTCPTCRKKISSLCKAFK